MSFDATGNTPQRDTLLDEEEPMELPYVERRDGGYYVAGSRVPLISIISEYRHGATAESIRKNHPALSLEQIHGAIAFFLGHPDAANGGLAAQSPNEPAKPDCQNGTADLRAEFEALSNRWRRETRHLSQIAKAIVHPAYLRIIGMGEPALPLILQALRDNPAPWFVALRAIANTDPAEVDARPRPGCVAGVGRRKGTARLMSRNDVEDNFPDLKGKNFGLSPEDFNYNCLAYVLGDYAQWWEPPRGPGQYWPPGFPEDVSVATAESIIRLHGYTEEIGAGDVPATEAIAVYAVGNEWTHFAKFTGGTWKAKLGWGHDVEGVTLADMEVPLYGTAIKILCRPRVAKSL